MPRQAHRNRPTCESCLDIDVRYLHRNGLLRPGQGFSISWSRGGEPLGKIDVDPMSDAVVLLFRGVGSEKKAAEQRVPIVWTRCHFGSVRPWFLCPNDAGGGQCCGRRVAKLYLRGHGFACRHCCGLAYVSQSETPEHRAISKAQKLRMRIGGGPNLLDPFPDKPARMHRQTYYRLSGKALAAQESALGLEIDAIRRRFPGLASEESGFPSPQDVGSRANRGDKFFTPRAVAAEIGRSRVGARRR